MFRRRAPTKPIVSSGSARAAATTSRLLAAVVVAFIAAVVTATPTLAATPRTLCSRSAFLPPPLRLPSFAPVAEFSFYNETPSPNALAHHVLCRVEITTPHSKPAYLYHISWEAFPTHADALADLAAFNPNTIYASPRVTKPVPGFASPTEVVTGRFAGQPITVVILVDGPALVSGFVLGGGTLAQAEALARWETADIHHLHVTG